MKAQILILDKQDFNFKTDDNKEISGTSLIYLTDDYNYQRSTARNEVLQLINSTKLPAYFEADVKVVQKTNNGKSQLKFDITSLKLVKETVLFTK